MGVCGDGMPFDFIVAGCELLFKRHEQYFLVGGSVADLPVAIIFPAWSLSSTPENCGITSSLKVMRICLGDDVDAPAAGSADRSWGWASATLPRRTAATNAEANVRILNIGL